MCNVSDYGKTTRANVIRKIKVCIFIEEGGVLDTDKCLGEIQTVDNNIFIGG